MVFDDESQRRTLRRAKEIVEECLSEDERCRNDDLWLILKVWQKKQHINIFIPYERLNEMISAETIRRIRQKIQKEDKKFVPTKVDVIRRRKKKEEFMRSEMLRPTNLVGIDFGEGGEENEKNNGSRHHNDRHLGIQWIHLLRQPDNNYTYAQMDCLE